MPRFSKGYPKRESFLCRHCLTQWSEVAPDQRMNGSECPQCGAWHCYPVWNNRPDQGDGQNAFVSDIRSWKVLEAWAKMAPSEDQIAVHTVSLTGRTSYDLSSIKDGYRYGRCKTSDDLARCIAADRLAKIAFDAPWYDTIRGPWIAT